MFQFIYYKQCCLLLCFILWSGFELPTYTSSLDHDEGQTLRQIAQTTGLFTNREAYSLLVEDPCKMGKEPYYVPDKGNLTVTCNHCSNNVCHITELIMKDLSLPGMLPKELFNLTYLEKIDFTRNCLEGSLPKEWAVMKHLNFISLTTNRLSGEIPKEWGNFPNLTYLSVEDNNLSGTVPRELGKLVKLTVLILSTNKFGGTLPKMLGDLKNLTDLTISDNSFEGSIPEFIGSLSELITLKMQATGMEGPISNQTFQGLTKLEDMRITDINSMGSTFPNLASSESIKYLILRNLNLSGIIPGTIWDMENLRMLDVSFNNLEGGLPSKDLPTLKHRFVGGNKLSGSVPDKFLSFGVNYVDISYNNFTWSPSCDNISMENVNSYRSSALTKNDGRLLPCSNKPNCQQSPRNEPPTHHLHRRQSRPPLTQLRSSAQIPKSTISGRLPKAPLAVDLLPCLDSSAARRRPLTRHPDSVFRHHVRWILAAWTAASPPLPPYRSGPFKPIWFISYSIQPL